MAKPMKLIVPQMRSLLSGADLATIESFEVRTQELIDHAPDKPTLAEFTAFQRVVAEAKALLLGGGPAVEPAEERLTEAEWRAKTGHPSPVAEQPAPRAVAALVDVDKATRDGELVTVPASDPESDAPAEEPKAEKKATKGRPYDRKRK